MDHDCILLQGGKGELMKRNALAIFILGLLMLSSLVVANNTLSLSFPRPSAAPADQPTISVDNVTKADFLSTFDVNINVTNAVNVVSYHIDLSYSTSFVKLLNFTNGDFLSGIKLRYITEETTERGRLQLWPWQEVEVPANDTGILVVITFSCVHVGRCDLILNATTTKLKTIRSGEIEEVFPKIQNGRVEQVFPPLPMPVSQYFTLPDDIEVDIPSNRYLFQIAADDTVFDLKGHCIRCTSKTGFGIEVIGMSNITITNGTIMSFQKGLTIDNCTNIKLINMSFIGGDTAISILKDSTDVQVYDSLIDDSDVDGICVERSSHVDIVDSAIRSNKVGVSLLSSHNCSVSGNIFQDNWSIGLELRGTSSDNRIWNNDFERNKNHTQCDYASKNNQWNRDYPWGGNFWDDYVNQTDNFSGSNQTQTRIPGPDGIGDNAYVIDDNNLDIYPLMNRYGTRLKVLDRCCTVGNEEHNTTRTYLVGLYTNSNIEEDSFLFDRTKNGWYEGSITLKVSGGNFCKAIIDRELIDNLFEVLVNDIPAACYLNWEGNLTGGFAYATFYYSGSNDYTIKIKGQIATRIVGDVNGDGYVDIIDISLVAKNWHQPTS